MFDRRLALFFVGSMAIAFIVIAFFVDQLALDPNTNKSWWSVSFVDPKSADFNFVITNHTKDNGFTYTISNSMKVIPSQEDAETIAVAPGESMTIHPLIPDKYRKNAVITIWHDKEHRMLNKRFE